MRNIWDEVPLLESTEHLLIDRPDTLLTAPLNELPRWIGYAPVSFREYCSVTYSDYSLVYRKLNTKSL